MMNTNAVPELATTYLRLRPDASVEALRGGAEFWQALATGSLGNFHNEYLVTSHAFEADWPMSEMHPHGDEVVCLLSGSVTFVLELADGAKSVRLTTSGAFVIVPKGIWHTAKTSAPARMLFITAGEGTQHRDAPRS